METRLVFKQCTECSDESDRLGNGPWLPMVRTDKTQPCLCNKLTRAVVLMMINCTCWQLGEIFILISYISYTKCHIFIFTTTFSESFYIHSPGVRFTLMKHANKAQLSYSLQSVHVQGFVVTDTGTSIGRLHNCLISLTKYVNVLA